MNKKSLRSFGNPLGSATVLSKQPLPFIATTGSTLGYENSQGFFFFSGGVYFDRTAGGHRYHCHPGGHAPAGVGQREGQSQEHQLPFQPETMVHRRHGVRGR